LVQRATELLPTGWLWLYTTSTCS